MTQTDRILSNIGAIRTLLENFPMGLFEKDGKTYTTSFEFIMDVLRSCGVNDKTLVSYLIGKIYGFEGKPEYTINGLYKYIKRGDIQADMQNPFIYGLEASIKEILMALLTSIFSCSALPILPNRVFDYDSLSYLMDYNVEAITRRNTQNDSRYKLKIPISTIDIFGLFSISPTTSEGSLYYLTNGTDNYYHKEYVQSPNTVTKNQEVKEGEIYKTKVKKYNNEYCINVGFPYFGTVEFTVYKNEEISQSPIDLTIDVAYLYGDMDAPNNSSCIITSGSSGECIIGLENSRRVGDTYLKTQILNITINGNSIGCEIGNRDELSWCYLSSTDSDLLQWENGENGGAPINTSLFGKSRSDETIVIEKVSEVTGNYDCEVKYTELVYKSMLKPSSDIISTAIRYTYVPNNVHDDDPDYIVVFDGINPNFVYRSYDMNAFLWYCYNRCNVSNQIEENHLMWDSRISASRNGVKLSDSEWNTWYASKYEEGYEFEYNANANSDVLYPIIQVEKYDEDRLLVRIPSQRYFEPRKRSDIYDGTYEPGTTYFNASIYQFNWEYLKNIQILNPKFLLVRLIENLIGFSLNSVSGLRFNLNKKRIVAVLEKAVESIISENDMEVEDCWKSFSNEDYNDLLNEMLLSRYTATNTNGESSKIRIHDVDEYIYQLDKVSSNAMTQGSKTMVEKTVRNIMMNPDTEISTEYSFDFGYDSEMLKKLIFAVVMPIVESLFTPQVMLLLMINFQILGITNVDEAFGNNYSKVINLLLNKIFGLVKSIVLFVKDKIVSLLLEFLNKIITPILTNMALMLYLEMITDWLIILMNAVKCIPMMIGLEGINQIGYIDEVDYADIVNEQKIPESDSEC